MKVIATVVLVWSSCTASGLLIDISGKGVLIGVSLGSGVSSSVGVLVGVGVLVSVAIPVGSGV